MDFTMTFVNHLLAVLSFNCISQVLKAHSLKAINLILDLIQSKQCHPGPKVVCFRGNLK